MNTQDYQNEITKYQAKFVQAISFCWILLIGTGTSTPFLAIVTKNFPCCKTL